MNKKWNNVTSYKEKGKAKVSPLYDCWRNMLVRATEEYALKKPSYLGTTIAKEWQSFDVFAEWSKRQHGFGCTDYKGNKFQLDKDLLAEGGKIYSPETCVFIPSELNNFLIRSKARQGKYLLGVCFEKETDKHVAQINISGKIKRIGRFKTEDEAHIAYRTAKLIQAKVLLLKYQVHLDPRVISKLNNLENEYVIY